MYAIYFLGRKKRAVAFISDFHDALNCFQTILDALKWMSIDSISHDLQRINQEHKKQIV
jgi:hypothetical protein